MSNFSSLSLSECVERLLTVKNPAVAFHIRPDGDSVGSATALCEIFRELSEDAVYIVADEIPERLKFLTEGIERGLQGSGRTVVSVDSASPSQLGDLYATDLPILSIDHHAKNTPYCDNYTLADASSAGEVLFEVAKELVRLGKIKMTKRIAERLYAAIASDTGGFIFANTSEKTYKAASELLSVGIDHADINRRLFNSKSMDQLKAEGYIASNIKTAADGKIAYATLSRSDRESIGLPFSAFETAIDILRSLLGCEIAFIIKETDSGEFKASIRSVGQNVAEVAARHNGGGHIRAAGCTIDCASMTDAEKILVGELSAII